ncbi:MAG: CsiV family protein [Steroidobacteraceae bacterium]
MRAAARVPLYRIELIVFRATAPLGTPEDWSAEAAAAGLVPPAPAVATTPASAAPAASTAPGSAITTTTAPAATAPAAPAATESPTTPVESPEAVRSHVTVLPPADFELDGFEARLRGSGRYVPIGHALWTQLASPWGRPIEIPIESLGLTATGLHGTIALERGEFLHLAVRLDYSGGDPPPGLGAAPGTPFVLDEVHRVRFYDRDYFDHPAFGVIALVTPAKAPRRPRP